MKADFPTVARPWQWGTRQSSSTVADGVGAWMGWGWPHPRAEASSAAAPRGSRRAAWDGCVSAKRCCGQPQFPRAGIRPRVGREVGTHVRSRGRWGKQREGGGKLVGSSPSPWPAQRQQLPVFSWHILPAWAAEPLQKTPSSFQGWERKDPLEFECGTATKCWQDTGIPGGWQAMAVLREGLRGGTASPGCPFHCAGSSLQGGGGKQSQCGEAWGTRLKSHSPNLAFPGSKAKISSRSRMESPKQRPVCSTGSGATAPKEKTAEGFEAPGWHLVGPEAPVGRYPNIWCAQAPANLVGWLQQDVPQSFPWAASAPTTAQ